jgi:uncharacterized protein (UPF0548 family)
MRPEPLLRDSLAREALDKLHDAALNFDVAERDELTAARGWNVDEYRQPLPPEAPGRVVPGGSWETARRLLRDYEFADPAVIRAVYHPEQPLEGREMLLEARFYGLRFHLGVRVGGVIDETRDVDDRQVRVWGWNYHTLQGHLEMGQMDYEVWKWLDSGEVEFRIRRLSKPARIVNPLVRLGFHLFGRREQVKFARSACERMARLTEAALMQERRAPSVPLAADTVTVVPAPGSPHRTGSGSRPAAAATVAAMTETKLLAIYLNDHLAALTVGRQLVKRMLGSSKDDAIRSFLDGLRPEIESSEREVERLLREIGSSPSRVKRGAAWAAERAGLLKFNGSLTGYSPLSRLLELEGLRVILEAERALWRSLERSASQLAPGDGDFAERAQRAEQRLERAEQLRLLAADVALAGTDGRHL